MKDSESKKNILTKEDINEAADIVEERMNNECEIIEINNFIYERYSSDITAYIFVIRPTDIDSFIIECQSIGIEMSNIILIDAVKNFNCDLTKDEKELLSEYTVVNLDVSTENSEDFECEVRSLRKYYKSIGIENYNKAFRTLTQILLRNANLAQESESDKL
jgi:hypothetical protein